MKIRQIIVFFFLCFVCPATIHAQFNFLNQEKNKQKKDSGPVNTISIQFNKAKNYYQRGKIDTALLYLNKVISEKAFQQSPKNIKAEFYNLKANCNFLLNNPKDADENIRKMLALQPFYAEESANPNDLLLVSDKVKQLSPHALPKNKIGISTGGGITNVDPQALNKYAIFSGNVSIPEGKYTPNAGFYISINIERRVSSSIAFELRPAFLQQKFSYSVDYSSLQLAKFNFDEEINSLMIPFGIKFTIMPTNRIKPYFRTGYFYRKLISVNRFIGSGNVPIDVTYFGFDHGIYYGGGVLYTRKHNTFTFDIDFVNSIDYVINPEKRYAFDEDVLNTNLFEYNYIQDDISLSNMVISVGYYRHLNYKVFKRK